MPLLDLDAIRREVRALEFERGTPADVAEWREADAESRANLAIEGMALRLNYSFCAIAGFGFFLLL